MNNRIDQNQTINVAIDSRVLAKMLKCKSVAAADLRCLDGASKKQLWRLCLQACADGNH